MYHAPVRFVTFENNCFVSQYNKIKQNVEIILSCTSKKCTYNMNFKDSKNLMHI